MAAHAWVGIPAGPCSPASDAAARRPCWKRSATLASTLLASRAEEEYRAREEKYQEQAAKKAAEREVRRPVCTGCGATFIDERWKAIERVGWGASPEPRPTLCTDCDRQFVTDMHQAWPDEHRHQEQEQALPEQKSGGTWLSRFRR